MKLYETHTAPNPRRVRMFLAEKGITDVEYIQVDLAAGDNLNKDMRAKNPTTKIPFLELDDGTCIGETLAICRYFEEIQPEPPLMGRTPLEKAQVEMWQRRVEFYFMMQIGMCFQHTSGYFKDRMTPVPEWGSEAGKNAVAYMKQLNEHLASSQFLVGDYFSVADINLICALDFARVVKIKAGEDHPHLLRWYQEVSSRPSAQA
ncbi:glutathione S-transferase family protein [Pseudomaricurvus sp.]|uniref:glutathione S-transferase family protein n=1 Tax=Pseudomaricurvus sp. TaxID=2004510 RepID=UPI003F6D2F9D